MSDNPLVNLEGLTKPVSDLGIALIEKIASAGYKLYEPHHIKRVAKAESKAAEIEAKSQINITDLERRAIRRWIGEEAQYQKNMEDTTEKSINQLNPDADPHAIDNDWIVKFFDKCRLVSDDKMQDLWANILSGEANCAGSYSPKTLTTLADMDKKVAMLFNTFCSLCLLYLEDPNAFLESPSNFKIRDARVPIIRDTFTDMGTVPVSKEHLPDKFAQKSKSIYKKYGFGFNEFQLLLEYGLIQDDSLNDYSHFWYNNEIYLPTNPSANRPFKTEDYQQITISGYRLSSVGKELFHIMKLDSPSGYLEQITGFFQRYYKVKIYRFTNPNIKGDKQNNEHRMVE